MESSISRANGKQTASCRIPGLLLAIAPLWLMLAIANMSATAQTSDDPSTPGTTSSADWTEFHRDNMQRWNPHETVLGVNNVGSLQLKWKSPIAAGLLGIISSSPAVVDGVVYFGSTDNNVYALNAGTGEAMEPCHRILC
jgi:glucose dehydrogenase